jgi:hypothetical protein
VLLDEAANGLGPARLVQDIEPRHHNRALRRGEHRSGALELRPLGRGGEGRGAATEAGLGLPGLGHADGEVEMHRAGAAGGGDGKSLVDHGIDPAVGHDEARLADPAEGGGVVEDLVVVAHRLGRIDGAGQGDQRHPVLLGIRDHVECVGDARPDRRDQDAGRPGRMPGALGHEAGGVLVLGKHEADAGALQRVDQRQHLAARNAEGGAAPGGVEPPGDYVGSVHFSLLRRRRGYGPRSPSPSAASRRRDRAGSR